MGPQFFPALSLYLKKAGDTMTGILQMPDGTSAAPSIAFSGDTDTGIYRASTNSIGLVGGGSSVATTLLLDTSTSALTLTRNGTTIPTLFTLSSTGLNASSSTQTGLSITPTINQSGTAGYTMLSINPTETATGSGTKLLMDLSVGGSTKFRVSNTGTSTLSASSGDAFILDGIGTNNTIMRLKDDGTETGAIFSTNGSTNMTVRAQASLVLTASNSGTAKSITMGSTAATFDDAYNLAFNATTGTKIGTATSQKLSLWNATPIVQPTTAVAAATFVANTSLIANDTATFDGYTIGQVVKALRNTGILA